MAFTPPIFNMIGNLWFGANTPNTTVPDFVDQEMQLYVTSRGQWGIDAADLELWVPPIYVRLPLASDANWKLTTIVECPAASGYFYRARWKERMHLGFPNEYRVIVCHQCDADGVWILRDVEGGPGPATRVADGEAEMSVILTGTGEASHGGSGSHIADGEAEWEFVFAAEGSATKTP